MSIDDDSHTEAIIEVTAGRGLPVKVSAVLNDSPERGPDRVRLVIFADGLRDPGVAYDLHNTGLGCTVDLDNVEGLGRALLTLAKALRRAGIDPEGPDNDR